MAQGKQMSRSTRRQATRIALLAFVAADCAGVVYVQHRTAERSAEVEQMAYAQPLVSPAAPAPALAFAPPAVVPVVAAPAAKLALAPAAAPVPVVAPAAAPVSKVASEAPHASRVAPVSAPAATRLAVTAPVAKEAAPVRRHAPVQAMSSAAADSAFASAFTLDGEVPESEHRFGQDTAQGAAGTGSLADLVAPREEPAPIFDKAGIAPVTGEAAAVDAPAPAPVADPAAPVTDEAPAPKG